MTALDQAFIKAYQQHGHAGTSVTGETRRTVPLSDTLAASQRESAASAVPAAAVLEAIQRRAASAEPKSASSQAMATEPLPRPAMPRPAARRPATAGPPVAPPHFAIGGVDHAPPRLNDWGIPEKAERLIRGDRPSLIRPALDVKGRLLESVCEPVASHPAASQPTAETLQSEQVAVEPESHMAEPVSSQPFAPQLQVDRFRWPNVCNRLKSRAGTALDDLASGLATMISQRGRVVGLASSRRGEGATTLMLCAGQRLADTGHRVILVDADVGHADLARRLGLLPECGWEDVLSGRLPIEEVVVQSANDRLAVLPLNGAACNAASASRITESLETLRAHYDAVLVNLAPLNESQPSGELLAAGLARHLDAAVVVHDVRADHQHDVEEACRRLEAEGVGKVVLVENFG